MLKHIYETDLKPLLGLFWHWLSVSLCTYRAWGQRVKTCTLSFFLSSSWAPMFPSHRMFICWRMDWSFGMDTRVQYTNIWVTENNSLRQTFMKHLVISFPPSHFRVCLHTHLLIHLMTVAVLIYFSCSLSSDAQFTHDDGRWRWFMWLSVLP